MKKTKDSQETKILRKPVARIETTADTGLTQAQVKERMEKGWSNAPVDSPSKTTKEIIISNVFTFQPDFSCDCSSAASCRCIS